MSFKKKMIRSVAGVVAGLVVAGAVVASPALTPYAKAEGGVSVGGFLADEYGNRVSCYQYAFYCQTGDIYAAFNGGGLAHLADATVELIDSGGIVISSGRFNGAYYFTDLTPGEQYTIHVSNIGAQTAETMSNKDVRENNPAVVDPISGNTYNSDNYDNDFDLGGRATFTAPASGNNQGFAWTAEAVDPNSSAMVPDVRLDAIGGSLGAVIAGFIWQDDNRDGVRDANELPIQGATVNLLSPNGIQYLSRITNAHGYYEFNVDQGIVVASAGTNYQIHVSKAGYTPSPVQKLIDPVVAEYRNSAPAPTNQNAFGSNGRLNFMAGDPTDEINVYSNAIDGGLVQACVLSGEFQFPAEGTDRLAGADRYATAVEGSKRAFPNNACVVYLASGENFPDGLTAGPVATANGGAVLFTQKSALPQVTADEIKRLRPDKIVVVGGVNSIDENTYAAVQQLVPNAVVTRVAGGNRYETNMMLISSIASGHLDKVFIADGRNFPDALGTVPPAAKHGAALMLVPGDATTLSPAASDLLDTLSPANMYIMGGLNAVSGSLYYKLKAKSDSLARIGGQNRYETSVLLNEEFFEKSDQIFVVSGAGFADALSSGPFAYRANQSPVYLSQQNCIPESSLLDMTEGKQFKMMTVFGGTSTLSDAVMSHEVC